MNVELILEYVWVIRPTKTGTAINYNGTWIEIATSYDEILKQVELV